MKITMYELLGLIKDGKAPKKVRYRYSYLYKNFKFDGETSNYISDKDFLFGEDITAMLDDTIEILEDEKKIPEKLDINLGIAKMTPTEKYISNTVNEIIDYLESEGSE